MATAPARERVDDATDKVTYYGDNGAGVEIVVCTSYEPNAAEKTRQAATQTVASQVAAKAATGAQVLTQQANGALAVASPLVQKSLVDVVIHLQSRLAKLEGSL